MNRKVFTTLVVAIILSSITYYPTASADYIEGEKSGTGTVIVGNVAPTITSMEINEGINPTNLTSVDPSTQYKFRVKAADNNKLHDIVNVTIFLNASTGTFDVFDKTVSYGFQYDNITTPGTPIWKELTSSGWSTSYTYLNPTSSAWPANSVEGTWNFSVTLYKTAHHETTWTMKGYVRDNGGLSATKMNGFGVNRYIGFTIPSSVSWSTINPPVQNASAQSMPANVAVTANDVVNIQLKGLSDLTGTPSGSIPLSNLYIGKTANPATNDGIKLSQTYQNLYTALSSPDGTSYPTYWFITVAAGQQTGTYSFTYRIQVTY